MNSTFLFENLMKEFCSSMFYVFSKKNKKREEKGLMCGSFEGISIEVYYSYIPSLENPLCYLVRYPLDMIAFSLISAITSFPSHHSLYWEADILGNITHFLSS